MIRGTTLPLSALAIVLASGAAQASRTGPALSHTLEFRASTFTPSAQEEAALAVAPDGAFTVVWSSRRQQQGRYGVYAQRFDPRGVALGAETPLNLWTESHATSPAIDFAPDGAAWAAWQSSGQDGWSGAIIARRFDASFAGSSEVLVNERTEGAQVRPVVASLPDGGAVIAWETSSPGQTQRVALRVLAPDGSARAPEFDAAIAKGARLATPSVAVRPDGSFAVACSAFSADGEQALGVRVRVFGADGAPVGEESVLSEPGAITPVEPSIAAAGEGFVVAWQDVLESATGYDVLAARIDASGRPLGETVVVNTRRGDLQNAAAVAVAPDGRISIAFNAPDGSGMGVYVREFDGALRPLGAESLLTSRTHGEQAMREAVGTRRLAYAADGTLVCAWQGESGFGDGSAANVTLRSPTPIHLGARFAGVTPGMSAARLGGGAAAAGAGPHVPPTFDPRDIDHAEREIVRSRSDDIGFTAIVNTGWTPPDPHMAVGPDHIAVMTNGAIGFFNKDGTKTFQDEIEGPQGFWGSVGATGFIFDPEVLYDHTSGRFIAMAAEGYAPGNRSYCLVAISDDSDPNGNWFRYRFDTSAESGDLFDSPNIGVTENALIITGDAFGLGARYPVYIYDKASMLVGDPPAITKKFLLSTSTQSAGYPRVTTGTGDTLYLLEHREGFNNTAIRVLAFRDLLTSPTVTDYNLTVPTYGDPENPPQKGTSSRPETFDARFWSVDQGPNGNIWGTHHINPSRVVARWYEVALNGWPFSGSNPTLVQSGDIDLGPDIRTFFSAINASDTGAAAISYARSSPNEYISASSSARLPCEELGEMSVNTIHKDTVGGYNSGRWGDYSAVEFDPSEPGHYWVHHEFAENGSWRTWVQGVHLLDPCLRADINGDGVVNTLDVLEFLNGWTGGGCIGDWNFDGVINTQDVLAFLNDWTPCQG